MNSKKLKLFLSLGISTIVLLLWGFLEPERRLIETRPDYVGEADAYVRGAKVRQFDVDGRLTHSLKGEELRHLPDSGNTLIDQPQMTLYREGKAPISATAELGELESGNEVFWLRQKARVYNQVDQRYRLESEYLKVLPELELVETDAAVAIFQPSGTTHARGMTADLSRDRLLLHNAVRGEYETQQP